MNIFILEDNLIQQQALKKMIKSYLEQHHLTSHRLIVSSRPEELLMQITQLTDPNLYFLDIEINIATKAGIDLAKQIRKHDPLGLIVFVTTHSEYMPLTFKYKLRALDFIDKALAPSEFSTRIQECLHLAQGASSYPQVDFLAFKNKRTSFKVPFADIFYFETTTINHRLHLVTKDSDRYFYASLNDLIKQDSRLFKCHKSYLINPQNIKEIDRTNRLAYFPNNEHCLIARGKLKTLINKFENIHNN